MIKLPNIHWTPSNDFLAQAAHFLLGLVAVFGPMALTANIWYPIGGTVVVSLYALIKEPFVDPVVEGDPFWTSGFLDLMVIEFGVTVAWILALTLNNGGLK